MVVGNAYTQETDMMLRSCMGRYTVSLVSGSFLSQPTGKNIILRHMGTGNGWPRETERMLPGNEHKSEIPS